MLEVQAVSRSFGDRRVLDDVSFTVKGGRMTGFVGGNGAGKTTTMRVILGVLSPDSGSVVLDGTPITAADRTRIVVVLPAPLPPTKPVIRPPLTVNDTSSSTLRSPNDRDTA